MLLRNGYDGGRSSIFLARQLFCLMMIGDSAITLQAGQGAW
jgi:hypothetical protein